MWCGMQEKGTRCPFRATTFEDIALKTNHEWEQLSPYNQVRRRTEMYFGSRDPHTQTVPVYGDNGIQLQEVTWVPSLFTIFRELADNSVDELVNHKRGKRLDVTYDPVNLEFCVSDDGGGLPLEWSNEHGCHAATLLLSSMFSGRNFNDDRGETRGLNGVGGKGVNYCSQWFHVEVKRDKKLFVQRFEEGDELQVGEPTIWPTNSRITGTKISFKLSDKVFHHRQLPESFVASRMYEIALCYPGLSVFFNGKHLETEGTAQLFGEQKPFIFDINEAGFQSKFWLLPREGDNDFAFSLVNAIPLFNGGTHLDAFRRHFFTGLLASLDRESRRRKLLPNRADVADGLLIYNITEMSAPQFDSQSKTRLINENISSFVRDKLNDPALFKQIIHDHPTWIDAIYQRCAARTVAKDSRDTIRQAKRNLRQKIEDLEDACGHDRSKCTLFLAEGDSAISGLVKARDPELHGGLPLLGKVLNVYGESPKRILENEALSKVMNSIGLIPGHRVNRHLLRYGKVQIATDADPDGANIAALLCNFFYTCWPELFDPHKPPYIHIFNTPLIIAVKGKQRRYWYADDYAGFDPEKFKGWEITRAKGLAALVKDDWKHVLAHPRTIPIVDDGRLKETLTLLFDQTKADQRKEWMGI